MAGDAQGQLVHIHLVSREPFFDFLLPFPGVRFGAGVGRLQVDFLSGEAFAHVLFHRVQHDLLGLPEASGFGEGVQLLSLNLQHRLDVQDGSDGRRGGGDPAALLQILQGVHGDVNAGFQLRFFQKVLDFRAGPALLCKLDGVQNGELLGDGDSLVVDDEDLPVIVLGQHEGSFAGIAQPAGHWDIDNFIIFVQKPVPQVHHIPRRGLGGGDGAVGLQLFIELLLGQGDVFKIQLVINGERHGNDGNPQLFCQLLRDSAVAVGCDCCFCHGDSPYIVASDSRHWDSM